MFPGRSRPTARSLARKAAAAAVLLASLAACNPAASTAPSASSVPSDSPTPTASPEAGYSADDIREAALTTVNTGSAALDFSIAFNDNSIIPASAAIKATGAATFGSDRRSTLRMNTGSLGLGSIEFIENGTDIYFRGEGFAEITKDPLKWLHVDTTDDSEAGREFAAIMGGQNDASLIVYYLLGASGDVKTVGRDTIDGVECDHVTLRLDLDLALANVPPDAKDALVKNIADQNDMGMAGDLDGETWVCDDGLVRRVTYGYPLPSAMGGGTMAATVVLSELGERIRLVIPDATEIVELADISS